MSNRWAFPNPFARNGCVPSAFAHVAARDGAFALKLADAASKIDAPTRSGAKLYGPTGRAWVVLQPDFAEWGRLAGVHEVERLRIDRVVRHPDGRVARLRRPTLTRFAKQHPTGRWVVFVRGHAVALIEGVIYGYYRERTLVEYAIRVAYTPTGGEL